MVSDSRKSLILVWKSQGISYCLESGNPEFEILKNWHELVLLFATTRNITRFFIILYLIVECEKFVSMVSKNINCRLDKTSSFSVLPTYVEIILRR